MLPCYDEHEVIYKHVPPSFQRHYKHRIVQTGHNSHRLRNHEQKRHCLTGIHAHTQYSYTPLQPYQGSDDSTSSKVFSDINSNYNQSQHHDISPSTIKEPPNKLVPGGICGHFVMDGGTLSNVDPLKEIASFLDKRSGSMPQSMVQSTAQSKTQSKTV